MRGGPQMLQRGTAGRSRCGADSLAGPVAEHRSWPYECTQTFKQRAANSTPPISDRAAGIRLWAIERPCAPGRARVWAASDVMTLLRILGGVVTTVLALLGRPKTMA